MSDVLTVVGTNAGITEKPNGWKEVQVAVPGKKYPVKLATKKSELIDQVRALDDGEIGTFSYKEVESDRINENTGKPYLNRYLEGVEKGGTPAPAGGSDGAPQMTEEGWRAKERRDFRSRTWAVTVSAFTHTIKPDEDPLLVFGRLRPFQRALYEDIVRDLEPSARVAPDPLAPQQPQPEPSQEPSGDTPPWDDDDIPF